MADAIEFQGVSYAPMDVIIDPKEGFWLFGYGSVVWKVDFEHDDRKSGYVTGFARRFWQSSPDHRGTPEHPGRVCTLLNAEDARALESEGASGGSLDAEYVVHGCAYHVPASKGQQVMDGLLFREKAGYTQKLVDVRCTDGSTVQALVFVGEPTGEHFAGYEADAGIAKVISTSVGPSGPNTEYFLKLYSALAAQGQLDKHLENIYAELDRLGAVKHSATGDHTNVP